MEIQQGNINVQLTNLKNEIKIAVTVKLFFLLTFILLSTWAYAEDTSLRTKHNGGFTAISGVAFQGVADKSHGWPVKVSSFDEALQKAKKWGLNAFHIYVGNDRGAGAMYPHQYVAGFESREYPRQCIGVIMQRNSVHD